MVYYPNRYIPLWGVWLLEMNTYALAIWCTSWRLLQVHYRQITWLLPISLSNRFLTSKNQSQRDYAEEHLAWGQENIHEKIENRKVLGSLYRCASREGTSWPCFGPVNMTRRRMIIHVLLFADFYRIIYCRWASHLRERRLVQSKEHT